MNNIIKRIANLLGESEDNFTIVRETESQYIVTTKNYKNYIYFEENDALIDFDSLSNNKKNSDKYLNEKEKLEYYENNQGLIGFALNKINIIDGVEFEELKDVSILGFAKALNTFNKNEGIKFSTYCVRCMLNELYYYLRKEQRKLMSNISFDKELCNDKDGTSVKIGDLIDSRVTGGRSIEDNALNIELRRILLECLSHLEDDEQFLITYRYGLNDNHILTQNKIAEYLEMSQANISKLEKTCLKKLRILMKKQNYIYNSKTKNLELNSIELFDTGADKKYDYLEKDNLFNIVLLAAERLHLNIDAIKDVQKTDNKNEFIVTFNTNNRVYAVVNNITTFVEVKKFELSKNDKFMELILDVPNLYIPKRDDVETNKYNIDYDLKKLKTEISKLSKNEKYIITHMYGILDTEQLLTNTIAKNLNLSITEVHKIRIHCMKNLRKKFKKA